jgi:hypothetical protein
MTVTTEMLIFVLGQLATAAGVYAAIRADLRELMVRVAYLERAQQRDDDK